MAQVSLSKALNIKNRLAGKVNKAKNLFLQHNSYREDQVQRFKAEELKAEYEKHSADLVKVKTAIALANAQHGVTERVYRMSEIKDKISTIAGLHCREGKEEVENYRTDKVTIVEWKAFITEDAKEKLVEDLTDELEKLQDEINAINHAQKVEIPN
ncbi:MAG TPA: hypothetical protein VMW10_11015 [Alphaproteobacteria bacterium]|nr:hypothetical protein [Alphaproteobacteria bacterium]